MQLPLLLYFMLCTIIFSFAVKLLPQFFLDKPNTRKKHLKATPQFGGIVFSTIFLITIAVKNIAPDWFIYCGLITVLIGALDDKYDLPWSIKLLIQLSIMFYISYTFWGDFNSIVFFNFSIPVSPFVLLIIFSLWFIGVFNAVNLIDGLDGLAAGFIFLFCISISIVFGNEIKMFSLYLSISMLSFLLFNQRSAKVFMGDSGSLFLGYFVAVLPLLQKTYDIDNYSSLDMTPFLILSSFLIADTTRVFLTRLVSGKSPMDADTIHLHHLILQNSGSYLLTLFIIFFLSSISGSLAYLNEIFSFNSLGMLIQISLLFLFILTPPAPTYVNFIWKYFKPFYIWQKENDLSNKSQSYEKTLMVSFFMMILCLFFLSNVYLELFNLSNALIFLIFLIFITFNLNDKIIIPFVQITASILFLEIGDSANLNILTKLMSLLLIISYAVFTFKKTKGTGFTTFSALDILVFLFCMNGFFLSFVFNIYDTWFFIIILSMWFNIGFLFRQLSSS